MRTGIILKNAIKCPDGTVIESRARHEFKVHTQKDGRMYGVDGGLAYLKRMCTDNEYQDMSVYSTDKFTKIRNNFAWGTYGKDGKQYHQVLLKDLSTPHLTAIIDHISEHFLHPEEFLNVFIREVKYRFKRKIYITEYDYATIMK